MNGLDRIVDYAINCHRLTNHMYGSHDYKIHLEMVYDKAQRFIHLVPEDQVNDILAACWCHDLIEDTRQTYNDVLKKTNKQVAEIVYALTNEKGRNRKERASEKYYSGIRICPGAVFVKICDRLANIEFSKRSGSPMFDKYRKESTDFYTELFDPEYAQMFDHMDELLNS